MTLRITKLCHYAECRVLLVVMLSVIMLLHTHHSQNDRMTVDEISLGKMIVGKMSLDEMAVDEVTF